MLRFKMNEKVEPVAKPDNKYGCMSHPGFEVYERIRSVGKSWQIVEVCDNDNVSFYAEHLHTGFKTTTLSGKGIEAYHKAVDMFKYCESLPAGQMPQGSSQQPIKPEVIEKTVDEIRKDELKEKGEKLDKMFQDIQDKLKKGRAEVDAEMMRRQLAEAKENMMELEKQFLKMNPIKVDEDND